MRSREHGQARIVVIVPTYDERETLPVTLRDIRSMVPDVDILVVDDASPDGTGALADAAAEQDRAIHVLHRPGKAGLGAAYIAGFNWALACGYDFVVEMDADGSHQAADLRLLIDRAHEADDGPELVLGSRWIPGGRVVNWPARRKLLSRGGNAWVRIMLGLGLRDATGGFRVYRSDVLRGLPLGEIQSQGYCFQVDMAWRVQRSGGRVVEVPITFVERRVGRSKMSRGIVVEALWRTTAWGVAHRGRQLAGSFRRRGRPRHGIRQADKHEGSGP